MAHPNDKNTAIAYTDKKGSGFTFNNHSYDDWRNVKQEDYFGDDNVEDDMSWDVARAEQLIADLLSVVDHGCEYVIDYENNGHERPVPVHNYIKSIEDFISSNS